MTKRTVLSVCRRVCVAVAIALIAFDLFGCARFAPNDTVANASAKQSSGH